MTDDPAESMQQRCRNLLNQVRDGEVDPSSPDAQGLLFAGLMRGFIKQKEADEAADQYWDRRLIRTLEGVEAGELDPKQPDVEMILEWGVKSARITKNRRNKAVKGPAGAKKVGKKKVAKKKAGANKA